MMLVGASVHQECHNRWKSERWRSAAPAPLEDLEAIFLVLIKGRDDRRAGLAGLVGFRAGRFCCQL